MKKIIIFAFFLLPFFSINSSADKPLVFNLTHTVSSESPSSVDKELTPTIEKLLKKPLVRFGRKLQKKYKIRVLYEASEKKLKYINGIIVLRDIHAEYVHNVYLNDYISTVTLTAIIETPQNKKEFEKDYSTTNKLHLGSQWARWIGINKSARFAIKNILDKILDDEEFGNVLLSADKQSFFSQETVTESQDKPTPSPIEERLGTLDSLKEKGLITEEEYKKKKQAILDEL